MPTNSYKIRIHQGDFQFEAEGDRKFVLEMLEKYEDQASGPDEAVRPAAKPSALQKAPKSISTLGKKLSVGEFIRQLGFKKHTDVVLAFGYYLEKHSGVTAFTAADINACYYEAKLESSNSSQMINQNIKRGLLMAAKKSGDKGRKAFTLTQSGEEYIEKRPVKATK